MDELVKSFLESEEGQVWLQDEEVGSMLSQINYYITELAPLRQDTILYMMRFFPEFCFEGVGYRFISQPQEKESALVWDESHNNFSWSVHTEAYRSVLKSLGYENHLVQIYQAKIRGLNLKALILHLHPYNERLKLAQAFMEREDEILVSEYQDLVLIETLKT